MEEHGLVYWTAYGDELWSLVPWGVTGPGLHRISRREPLLPALDNDQAKVKMVHGKPARQLLENYLVVTTLPNFLSPRFYLYKDYGYANWPFLVVFEGMNGIGTRGGLELMLRRQDIRGLVSDMINGQNACQAIFRVYEIRYSEEEQCDKANEIELIDGPVPLPDDVDYHRAHEYVTRRLPWIAQLEAAYRTIYGRS